MNLQRKLALVAVTGAVALGAGHVVQNKAAERVASDLPKVTLSSVVPVAAGPDEFRPRATEMQQPVLPAEAAPIIVAQPESMLPPEPPSRDILAAVEAVPDVVPTPLPPEAAPTSSIADNCAMQLDLMAQPGAMVGITLLAPCNPDQRVVLRHAGLAVTGRTSASGALFAGLPALTAIAEVEIAFASGEKTSGSVPMPDFAGTRRFAVQWQDADAFQLHAFENGAGYDQPGHISAAFTGTEGQTGVLTLLGDASTALPLLAEVYSFGPDENAEIVVEAAVTEGTCGREILGETVLASDGSVEITDLTVAMPGCDAIGDILVLKNLAEDMTLTAAN